LLLSGETEFSVVINEEAEYDKIDMVKAGMLDDTEERYHSVRTTRGSVLLRRCAEGSELGGDDLVADLTVLPKGGEPLTLVVGM
jgi:hypothetical protein